MHIKVKTLIPFAVSLLAYLLSPDFYNLLPDKYSHLLMLIAALVAVQFPQLFKKNVKER